MDDKLKNQYGLPSYSTTEDQRVLYGGGDHSGPAQPDTSESVDTLGLAEKFLPGQEFSRA
jgi:hypothetical protein